MVCSIHEDSPIFSISQARDLRSPVTQMEWWVFMNDLLLLWEAKKHSEVCAEKIETDGFKNSKLDGWLSL